MADINQVILVGRLTRDMDKRQAGSLTIGKISLAVNRRVKKGDAWQDEASFFEAEVLGRQAESLSPYLLKGQQVAITGELKQDRWEKDGQKQSRVLITVKDLQLLGRSQESGGQAPRPQAADGGSGESFDVDDDIPF